MTQRSFEVVTRLTSSPDHVYRAVADSAELARWTGAGVSQVSGDGDVGSVRRVKIGLMSIDEEVLAADPPRRFIYRISRGLPLSFHRGEILISETDDGGSELRWSVTADSRLPFFSRIFCESMRRGLAMGLKKIDR